MRPTGRNICGSDKLFWTPLLLLEYNRNRLLRFRC
jgi:hypothetical protein